MQKKGQVLGAVVVSVVFLLILIFITNYKMVYKEEVYGGGDLHCEDGIVVQESKMSDGEIPGFIDFTCEEFENHDKRVYCRENGDVILECKTTIWEMYFKK